MRDIDIKEIFIVGLVKKFEQKGFTIDRVWKFFDQQQIEAYLYDPFQKDPFEIFESLKIYIERVSKI